MLVTEREARSLWCPMVRVRVRSLNAANRVNPGLRRRFYYWLLRMLFPRFHWFLMARYYACHTGLADWEGTKIEFAVLANGERKTLSIARNGGPNFVPVGPVFPPTDVQTAGRQSYGRTADGFGYIHLRDVPANLPEQIDTALTALGEVPGLILDARANGGGSGEGKRV